MRSLLLLLALSAPPRAGELFDEMRPEAKVARPGKRKALLDELASRSERLSFVDAETGRALPGVALTLKHRADDGRVKRFTARTDRAGVARVPWSILQAAEQQFCLTARKKGYDELRRTLTTKAGMFGVGGRGARFLLAASGARRAVKEKCALDIIEKLDRPKASLTVQVHFRFAEHELTAKGQAQAAEIASALTGVCEGDAAAAFVLRGHTDGRGRPGYNRALSLRRARAVMAAVEELAPDLSCKVTAEGAGESEPEIADAKTEAEHARNRRVEIRRSA